MNCSVKSDRIINCSVKSDGLKRDLQSIESPDFQMSETMSGMALSNLDLYQ